MGNENKPRRRYELKQRADEMAATRRRITEAAVELHGTIGPARTTVSAVADLAGVQRHTVYRHFPTDTDLFAACSSHYFAAHPLPDLQQWREIDDPDERLALALDDLYAYYERTEPMFTNVFRDVALVDAIAPNLAPLQDTLTRAVDILRVGRAARGRQRRMLDAALGHAIDFQTWRSLTAEGRITREEAIELAGALVAGATTRPATATG